MTTEPISGFANAALTETINEAPSWRFLTILEAERQTKSRPPTSHRSVGRLPATPLV
jgi:hypothetical protein